MDPGSGSESAQRTVDADSKITKVDGFGSPSSVRSGPHRGEIVGRYVIVDELGAGGMGVVFRAYDPDLDRAIALKLVRVGAPGGSAAQAERARLLREAQAMARLSHPNVIAVYDVGMLDGEVFVAMEYVAGQTLKGWQKRTRPWHEVLAVYQAAGRGLAAAHGADLIHRDFKPDNVMIGEDDRIKVLDFGLARAVRGATTEESRDGVARHTVSQSGSQSGSQSDSQSDSQSGSQSGPPSRSGGSLERSMTAAGAVLGTPAYMSPEQHIGIEVGAASDQFSFCVALYEALYGVRPFEGETLAALAFAVTQGDVRPPPEGRGVPRWLDRVVRRGLRVEVGQRYPTMRALLADLARDRTTKRRRLALGVATFTAIGAAGAFGARLSTPPDPCTEMDAPVRAVWTKARRAAMAEAFTATELAFADRSYAAVSERIEEFATTWVSAREDSCQATHLRGDQSATALDRSMACLDGQLRDLDALVDGLTTADAGSLPRAIDAASRLPSPAACRDVERLIGRRPLPSDEATLARLAEIESGLSKARAQVALGRYAEAGATVTALLPEAQAIDEPNVLARLWALQAVVQDNTGKTKDARRSLETGFSEAVGGADDTLAVEIAIELVSVVGYRLADDDGSAVWAELSRTLLERTGRDPRLGAVRAMALGSRHTAAGRYEDARAEHERAREHWAADPLEAANLARTLDNLGAIDVRLGRYEDAIARHTEALEIKTRVYGDAHPDTARTLRELGDALAHNERFDEAMTRFEQAMAIQIGTHGEHSQSVAVALDDIGRVFRKQGRLDDALAYHERALTVWRALFDEPHPDLAISVLNVGYTLTAASRHDEALQRYVEALEIIEASVGSTHPHVIYACNAAASTLVDLRRYADAVPYVDRVLAIPDPPVDPTLIAETKFIGTHALWGEGNASARDRARARRLAREAHMLFAAGDPALWGVYATRTKDWVDEHPQ